MGVELMDRFGLVKGEVGEVGWKFDTSLASVRR